jgi:GTP-binding protein
MKNTDGRNVFSGEKFEFLLGAADYEQAPNHQLPEVAFLGASNIGKSSLINSLVGSKIARVSNTPGRTQQLNFFKNIHGFCIVDMPGYGYAKANAKLSGHWLKTSFEYLKNRKNLRRIFLLLTPEKGLKQVDLDAIEVFHILGVSFQIVLTKTDRVSKADLEKFAAQIEGQLKIWPSAAKNVISTSANKGYGIKELQKEIIKIVSL